MKKLVAFVFAALVSTATYAVDSTIGNDPYLDDDIASGLNVSKDESRAVSQPEVGDAATADYLEELFDSGE